MVLKVRATLVEQRTQLINTMRGHAAEFGVVSGRGTGKVAALLAAIAADTAIPPVAQEMLALLGEQTDHLDCRIKALEAKLDAMHKADAISQLLATVPGIGPIIGLSFAIEVDPAAFTSGRHLAAWLGLTPQEHSTGGKQRLGGISRAGNERLRALLVSGAMAVIRAAERAGSKLATEWLLKLLARRPKKVAAVAPAFAGAGSANKMARMIWAMMTTGEAYRQPAAPAAARLSAAIS